MKKILRETKVNFVKNLQVFEEFHNLARKLNKFPLRNLLERIELNIRHTKRQLMEFGETLLKCC